MLFFIPFLLCADVSWNDVDHDPGENVPGTSPTQTYRYLDNSNNQTVFWLQAGQDDITSCNVVWREGTGGSDSYVSMSWQHNNGGYGYWKATLTGQNLSNIYYVFQINDGGDTDWCGPGGGGTNSVVHNGQPSDYSNNAWNFSDTSLPVELTSFTATPLKGATQLSWITESEIDNLGFLIDRSFDPISGFETIADYRFVPELQGQGSVTYRTDYSYTDTEVVPGTKYYYVLSDVTGNPEHGEPVTRHTDKMVNATPLWADPETGILKDFRLLKVYPNPFNPVASISYASDVDGNIQMDIVGMNGNVVKSLINDYHSAGSYELDWAPDELSAGVYFCRMISEEHQVTRKFIYLK
jgi:hypothetical protein